MNNKLIQSYVWNNDKVFFVSTANRESSAEQEYSDMNYAETLVWEYDPTTRKQGRIIGQFEEAKNAISVHVAICQKLSDTGSVE